MIAWAIEALLASAALLALVLALRVPVRRAFGPQVAYALWALPLLRLLLPPLPDSWSEMAPAPLADAGARLALFILPPDLPEAEPSLLGPALVLVWSAGAAAFLLWQLGSYLRFVRRVAASGTTLGRVGRIALVVSDHVAGPLAYGLARPVVAVPRDFRARYDAAERELALLHEVGHHRRGDVYANWAALGVLAIHWFNPLAWIAFRAFRFDQEMANDASVLAGRDPAERYAYACALVRAGSGRVPAGACELHTIDDLKGRLRMLANTTSRGRRAAGSAVIAGATLALLGLTASGGTAAERVRAKVEQATGVQLAALSPAALLQAPPAPPAPPEEARPGSHARHVHAVRHNGKAQVTVTEDGRTRHLSGDEAESWLAAHPAPVPPAPPAPPARPDGVSPLPPLPPMPPEHAEAARAHARAAMRDMPRIVSEDCRSGAPGFTQERREGGSRVFVICTKRIQDAARRAELASVDAARISREAMGRALESLRRTRESMASGRGLEALSAERRREALSGIDSSIAELERESAERD